MEKNKEKVKLRFILPLGLAILVLLATCIITLHQLHNHQINQEVQKSLNGVSRLFRTELEEDAGLLEGMIGFLHKDKNLQDAWLAGDRQSLQRYASPIFEEIRSRHKVTHFYFHGLDKVNFLRVHEPQKHGDYIDRFTMNQAAGSGKSAWGIELGPLGTLTLRFVYPWRIDGKPAGYIELGQEIEHITSELAEIAAVELFFVINKSYLNRAGWEQGMEMLGQTADWDQFPHFVISDRSLKQLPPKVHKHLSELSECQSKEHLSSMFNVSLGKHRYRVGLRPLIDAGGQDVGDIIVLKDITSQQASLRSLSISLMLICSAVGVLLLVFFYIYTTRIEQRLKGAYKGLLTEIEHHKQTKEKVQKQNKFLDNVLESLTYPFLVIDANDYTVKLANSAANAGQLPENVTCYMVSHRRDKPCDGTSHPCPLLEVRKTKKPVTAEHVHFDKDGNPQNVEIHCFPIFDNNGNVSEVIEYSWDITERKQAEEQLETARHKAEAANVAKSQFLANMSHEIRTPMSVIMGFADLLSSEGDPDERQYYVDLIQKAGKSLLRIIDDILDVSKIEAEKLEIEIKDCSLDKLLSGIEVMMQPMATDKDLQFDVLRAGNLPDTIQTDSGRLRQCLINLIGNAIKFTERGHVHLKVSACDMQPTPFLRFDVEDTGIGIPQDKHVAVFETFSQADESHTRQYGGTGLGLTIAKQLAEILGGELTLTSEVGKGSVFSLTIPANVDMTKQPLLDRQNFAGNTDHSEAKAGQSEFSGNVLVAEDNPSNQMLFKSLLEHLGLRVTIAEDGNEALQKILTQQFDLIFMDMMMPHMNGYEAAKELKKQGIKTPVIAVTANAMKGDDKKCLEAGCDEYLAKPIDHRKLLKMLDKYLSPTSQDRDYSAAREFDAIKL